MNQPTVNAFIDELEKIARAESHKSLMSKAEPGDIIHVGMADRIHGKLSPKGWLESVFRGASRLAQGSMTHSAIYVGNGKIVESRIGEGVKLKSFKSALRDKDYVILRPKTTKKKRAIAAKFAKSQVGKDYDSLALIQTGAGRLLPNWATNLIGKGRIAPPENAKAYTCSNLLTAAYRKADIKLGGSLAAPFDLRVSNKTKSIGKRIRKGFEETAPLLSPLKASKLRSAQKSEGGFVTNHPMASVGVVGAGVGGAYLLNKKMPLSKILRRLR